jgi:hypothetical protein
MQTTAFTLQQNLIINSKKADLILKVRILETGPAVTYDWGYEERSVICSPLKTYKGVLPDTASLIGFTLKIKSLLNTEDKNPKDTLLPIEVGKEYILFLSTKNVGKCNYLKENKMYPLYLPSGKTDECVLAFSDSLEKQLKIK